MKNNWIETPFITYHNYHMEDGSVKTVFKLFGVFLIHTVTEQAYYHTGFSLSLYALSVISGPPCEETCDDLKRYKTFPLLKLLLGVRREIEVDDPAGNYATWIGGKRYQIRTFQRWDGYQYWVRWFSIKGTWRRTYAITADDGEMLPAHTFAPREWWKRTPSPEEILNTARRIQAMHDSFAAGMKQLMSE